MIDFKLLQTANGKIGRKRRFCLFVPLDSPYSSQMVHKRCSFGQFLLSDQLFWFEENLSRCSVNSKQKSQPSQTFLVSVHQTNCLELLYAIVTKWLWNPGDSLLNNFNDIVRMPLCIVILFLSTIHLPSICYKDYFPTRTSMFWLGQIMCQCVATVELRRSF